VGPERTGAVAPCAQSWQGRPSPSCLRNRVVRLPARSGAVVGCCAHSQEPAIASRHHRHMGDDTLGSYTSLPLLTLALAIGMREASRPRAGRSRRRCARHFSLNLPITKYTDALEQSRALSAASGEARTLRVPSHSSQSEVHNRARRIIAECSSALVYFVMGSAARNVRASRPD